MKQIIWIALAMFAGLCLSGQAAKAEETIKIDGKKRHQTIEGFGTCLVSWGRYPDIYDKEMAKIYADDMGCTMLRVNVWGDNHRTPTENAKDISRKQIDLNARNARRTKIFIDFAKKLKKHCKDLKVIGTVWSPPVWMKVSKSIKGVGGDTTINADSYKKGGKETRNRVDPKYFEHYAHWVVEMLKLHKKEGVPFYAISPGNEIMFNEPYESCEWTAKDWATIVAMIGELKDKEGFKDVKIYGPETMTGHNWSVANPLYIKEIMDNKKAKKYLDVWAAHGYTDGVKLDASKNSSLDFWNLIKDTKKPYWMTEGGTGDHNWPKPLSAMASAVHNSLVSGNASAFLPWQITGDKADTHVLMLNKTMTKKSQCARHYFKFIRPDAVRIDTDPADDTLKVSAFHHKKDKTLTIIVINANKEEISAKLKLKSLGAKKFDVYRTSAEEDLKKIESVTVKSNTAKLVMPPESIVTLVAKNVK